MHRTVEEGSLASSCPHLQLAYRNHNKVKGSSTEFVYPSSLKSVITLTNTRYVAIQAWTPKTGGVISVREG